MSLPLPFGFAPLRFGTSLLGQRILVVEDCHPIAQDLVEALEREGATVLGPVASVDDARRLALETEVIDGAVLDVNLRGEMIWPVADLLSRRDVRLVFATGYAAAPIRRRYAGIRIAEKPAPARMVVRLLADGRGTMLVHGAAGRPDAARLDAARLDAAWPAAIRPEGPGRGPA